MQLPSDEIGISDILQYRDCPQKFAFGMRRHVPLPERLATFEGEKDDPPEATNENNAYGSAIHDCIAIVEKEQVSDQEAIDRVWPVYQHYLDPDDLERLKSDLELYHERTPTGWRLVAAETDMRVPLFVHEGRQIYFRFKLDALYQHLQNPAVFLSRDYKSSKWPKSQQEVDNDLQQWSYNFGIHEMFPECSDLTQEYDQLTAGVIPTRKTAQQRQQIKNWLAQQVKSILKDEVLKPTINQWCPWCPIIMDCTAVHRSADFWKNRIEAIAPSKKVGRKVVVQLSEDAQGFVTYAELLPRVELARKTLERFENEVKSVIEDMPSERRAELGYEIKERNGTAFPAETLRKIHKRVGDDIFQLVSLSKTSLERFYGKGKKADQAELRDEIIDMGKPTRLATYVQRVNGG